MAGLAAFAIRSALAPLRRIEAGLAAREPRDLTPLDVAVPREIGALVGTINRFMARQARQFEIMRNLIADASHQLRTPVAAIRAQAEPPPTSPSPARQRVIVARIHDRAVGLSRLTDQLLNHALIIHRADAAPHEMVDLRSVAIRIVEETDARTDDLRLDLPEDPVACRGDALSLAEAGKNLVNNALRHGARAGDARRAPRGGRGGARSARPRPGHARGALGGAGARFDRTGAVTPQSASIGLSIVAAVAPPTAARCASGEARPASSRRRWPCRLCRHEARSRLPGAPCRRRGGPASAGGNCALRLGARAGADRYSAPPMSRYSRRCSKPSRTAARGRRALRAMGLERPSRGGGRRLPRRASRRRPDRQLRRRPAGQARQRRLRPAAPLDRDRCAAGGRQLARRALRRDRGAGGHRLQPRPRAAREVPRSRFDLIDLLRPADSRYAGRIATYDIEDSGLGYLFAFADSQQATTFGSLIEAFARSGAVATCCSAEIIDGVAEGRYLIAYNVLGSYALDRAAERPAHRGGRAEDYTLVLRRAAMIPKGARNPPRPASSSTSCSPIPDARRSPRSGCSSPSTRRWHRGRLCPRRTRATGRSRSRRRCS